jgi:hypothetical protein
VAEEVEGGGWKGAEAEGEGRLEGVYNNGDEGTSD